MCTRDKQKVQNFKPKVKQAKSLKVHLPCYNKTKSFLLRTDADTAH